MSGNFDDMRAKETSVESRLDGCIKRAKRGPPCVDPSFDELILKTLMYIKTGEAK